MRLRFLIPYIIICPFLACSTHEQVKDNLINHSNQTISFAKGFTISITDSVKSIRVINPWQGANDISYNYLFIDSSQINNDLDALNTDIFIAPLKRIVCLSTTHIAFIDALSKSSTIVGASGVNFINSSNLKERVEKGLVKDVGYDQNLNYELIVSLKPDAVLCYGVGAESVGYLLKLKELGIKLIFIGDYLEQDPLGKAEWLKVFGTFFNQNLKADSMFNSIAEEYSSTAKLVKSLNQKPKVFLNLPWKDSWFFPGNSNYFVKLIEDAGGDYVFSSLTGSKSYPISFEKAIEAGYNSDIWLNPGSAMSIRDIKNTDERLTKITPCNNNKVYNNNNRMSIGGGNDFWESGVIHPDLILKDLIFIFHPDLLPNHQFYYYKKLE
ncbi:MAG: ABC transporter substrate-binding protein [Tenuifilaceae bacterium]